MQSTSVRLESTFTYSVGPIAYPLMVLLDAGPSRGESRAGGIKALLSLTCMLMNQGQSQIAILVLRHAAILAVPHASSRRNTFVTHDRKLLQCQSLMYKHRVIRTSELFGRG